MLSDIKHDQKRPQGEITPFYWILWDKVAWELESTEKVHVEITSCMKNNFLPCENYLEIVFS